MERKEFSFQLNDGKNYIFSERNIQDISIEGLQEKLRAKRTKFINQNVPDREDRFGLLMNEMQAIYNQQQINIFLSEDYAVQKELIYSSFKIKNPEISFPDFEKLVDVGSIRHLLKLVNELETIETTVSDSVIAKELKVNKTIVDQWKKDFPDIYDYLKKNVKKKATE